MHWWGNASTGQVRHSAVSPGPGWAQFPPSTDRYSLAQIQAYVKAHTETAPVDNSVLGQIGTGAAKAATGAAGSVLGDFTGGITGFHGSNFVVRAAKIIIGGMLLLIGLAHITGADNAAANIARKVPIIV